MGPLPSPALPGPALWTCPQPCFSPFGGCKPEAQTCCQFGAGLRPPAPSSLVPLPLLSSQEQLKPVWGLGRRGGSTPQTQPPPPQVTASAAAWKLEKPSHHNTTDSDTRQRCRKMCPCVSFFASCPICVADNEIVVVARCRESVVFCTFLSSRMKCLHWVQSHSRCACKLRPSFSVCIASVVLGAAN